MQQEICSCCDSLTAHISSRKVKEIEEARGRKKNKEGFSFGSETVMTFYKGNFGNYAAKVS